MHRIVRRKHLNPEICLIEIEAADIAASAGAGQFIILRVDEKGERFPLTLYDWNAKKGTVTVVCQAVGVSTKKLCALKKKEGVLDVAGPLGRATETENIGKVICIGGGVGAAEAYPVAKAMKSSSNDVTVIIGARTKKTVICEDEIRKFCDKVHITTDDGSCGRKGLVTDVLAELLEKETYDLVFAIGPLVMMRSVSEMTKPRAVRTLVSLNSIMIDGTGMCGGCRLRYGGEEGKFTCVDGPEFDGHRVDFDDLMRRQARYEDKEKMALKHYEEECRIGLRKKG